MPIDPTELEPDEDQERNAPKRLRTEFQQRRRPVAARSSSHNTPKRNAGLHRRRNRHYGL
ncbi:MAG: hypothetical protein HYX69_14545 [Planctomycetia bacterium]|nr:hypothetical protein [Planctomycetia bacterium]